MNPHIFVFQKHPIPLLRLPLNLCWFLTLQVTTHFSYSLDEFPSCWNKKKEAQFKKRLLDPVLKECFFSCLLDRVWQFAPGHIAPNVGLHLGIHCETVGSGCHVVKLTNFSSSSKLLHFFSSVRSMLFFLPSVTVAAAAADSYLRFRFLYDLSAGKDKKRRQIQTRKTLS